MLDSLRLVSRVLFAIFCVGLFTGCTNAPNRYLGSTDTTSTRDGIQTVQIRPSETISPSNNLPTTELITSTPKSSIFHYETGNRLFVFHDGYITLFDTFSHKQEKATFPIYCKNGLLPHTELLYCDNETDLLLLDPISKESQIIGTGINPNIYKSSPSGEFLLLLEKADDIPVFVRYNMSTKELRNFQIDKKPSDNISFPIISDNGNYVAYVKRNNEHKSKIITENIENKGTQEFSIIYADEFQLINWFPDSQKILVGASDLNTDMPGYFNYLYILDVESNIVRLISKAYNEFPYEYLEFFTSPNILSPNGELILMPSDQGVCVINVSTGKQSCFDLENAGQIKSFDWSPNGDKVAIVASSTNLPDEIFLLTYMDMGVQEITDLTAINIDYINWR